ncbi:hypothetical protein [Microterricola viridarii]|uniref:Uncharacterized protein n=1 Tax=Microterricola viridarii TaxID=412690 RepID=A0A0Y0NYJ9_9MICO|nr:hypothetical protein [Microterricola viridarii]AMB59819.1 hypothetical protein AWU67_14190 [Microterricola viridarii]
MNERIVVIERWWPQLSAEGKHEIQADLDAVLSAETVAQIAEITGLEIVEAEWVLTAAEKDFIRTQGEPVD